MRVEFAHDEPETGRASYVTHASELPQIPKQLHYVWVGGPMPDERRAFVNTWSETNPDFEIVLWNESNIDFSQPVVRWAYESKRWATVADIVRLMAVAKHGGIYLDTDFRLFKSLTPLLHHSCFYGFQLVESSPDWVANGAFGAIPGHWFVNLALQRTLTVKNWFSRFGSPTLFGPKLITKLLREQGLASYSPLGVYVQDIYLLPTPVFYPFGWNEQFTADCVSEETLAAHFWADSDGGEPSWVNNLPASMRAYRRVRRALRNLAR